MNFADRLLKAIEEKQNPSCAGLDPRIDDIPEELRKNAIEIHGNNFSAVSNAIIEFNRKIIDAVHDIVPAVKPNIALYECYGAEGMKAFVDTVHYAKKKGLIVIEDGKKNDIGSTAQAYAEGHLGVVTLADGSIAAAIDADAMTLNPYLGRDSLEPFVGVCKKRGKGIFILCKTSNPSSKDVQDINVGDSRVYEIVAKIIYELGYENEGNSGYSFVGAVVGATFPEQARKIRNILQKSIFLVPGYGAQGGTAKETIPCFNKDGYGAIINSSRDIIFAYKKMNKEFDEAARIAAEKMKEEINKAMRDAGICPW